jgi:RHS repeat-associated protein
LTFTAFNKIADIEGYNNTLSHTYKQEFTYGPQRFRRLVKTYEDGVHIKNRVYAGRIYEEVTDHQSGTTEKHHYIYGGDGLAAILVTQGSTENLYYVHKDYLGSILALSDESGNIVERYSFDAWGHRRNPSDWSQWENGTSYITDRGFTGHQHMDLFGLINMNGRIYDPDLGRFISPDPYVQMPGNSQNFNRYSYALNNPLVYTDPSGEWLWLAIVAGAYFGGVTANEGEFNPLDWDYTSADTYLGMGIGGLAGWAGASAGMSIGSSALAGGASGVEAGIAGGMIGGMASGGINGLGMTAIAGGDFNDIMSSMTQGMVMGAFSGALAGGVGAGIGTFTGVEGSGFKNAMFELGHSALKGGSQGLAGGAMMAAMNQDASYLWKGAAMGAGFSVGMAGVRILSMGPTIPRSVLEEKYGANKYIEKLDKMMGNDASKAVYRRNLLERLKVLKTGGITLGRNLMIHESRITPQYSLDFIVHERVHYHQILNDGVLKFYGKYLGEWFLHGFKGSQISYEIQAKDYIKQILYSY